MHFVLSRLFIPILPSPVSTLAFTLLGRFKKKKKRKSYVLITFLSLFTYYLNPRTIWNFSLSQKFFLSFCSNPTYEIFLKILLQKPQSQTLTVCFLLIHSYRKKTRKTLTFAPFSSHLRNPNLMMLTSYFPINPQESQDSCDQNGENCQLTTSRCRFRDMGSCRCSVVLSLRL